jgi:gliding motility-associated-like protein
MDNSKGTVPRVWPNTTTTYEVIITENQCFRDTLEQEVEVVPLPTVELGPDLEIRVGTEIRLEAAVTGTSRIYWTPSEGLSCTDCYAPTHTVRGRAMYIAEVQNSLGCPARDTIHIKDICDAHYFYFANVFTPNGDGQNDRFYPQGVANSRVLRFMIYDRWGEIVFSTSNIQVNEPNVGWDGTFRNQALKPDVYLYVAEGYCEDGRKLVLRGDISLIR